LAQPPVEPGEDDPMKTPSDYNGTPEGRSTDVRSAKQGGLTLAARRSYDNPGMKKT